jgi:hypothetical protein
MGKLCVSSTNNTNYSTLPKLVSGLDFRAYGSIAKQITLIQNGR